MKITICGLAGTGTSTAGKLLAERTGFKFVSSGGIFRQKAKEAGLDLNEFEDLCGRDDRYDRDLDAEIGRIGRSHSELVVESRLAWHFIPDSFKVKIICDDETRTARVAERDQISLAEAREKTAHREALIRQRYQEYYDIENFDADRYFDCRLDTTSTPPKDIVKKILELTGLSAKEAR